MDNNDFCIVDSNIWIGLYKQDDSLHYKSVELFKKYESEQAQFVAPSFVIEEVFSVLSLRTNQAAALAFYHQVTNNSNIHTITLDAFWVEHTVQYIKNHTLPVHSLVDYALIFLALETGLNLITFDKQLMNTYQEQLA